jgi:hypothetical protein
MPCSEAHLEVSSAEISRPSGAIVAVCCDPNLNLEDVVDPLECGGCIED